MIINFDGKVYMQLTCHNLCPYFHGFQELISVLCDMSCVVQPVAQNVLPRHEVGEKPL